MNLENNIRLNAMADTARSQFEATSKRLEELEGGFQSKMRGRTMGGVIASFLGTTVWLIIFGMVAYWASPYVNSILLLVTLIAVGILVLVMYVDDAVNFKYFNKVSLYKSNVSQLISRVRVGRDSINANKEEYMKARGNGWNYGLNVGSSIPDEASSIEATMSSMDSLKNGFLSSSKTGLYYIVAILFTLAGSMVLFDSASGIITGVMGEDLSGGVLSTICWIVTIVVCVAEIFIAKLAWSGTDCNVNNLTIGAVLPGPLMFIGLILVGTLLVRLVIFLISILLAIAAVAIGIACACGMLSGG